MELVAELVFGSKWNRIHILILSTAGGMALTFCEYSLRQVFASSEERLFISSSSLDTPSSRCRVFRSYIGICRCASALLGCSLIPEVPFLPPDFNLF